MVTNSPTCSLGRRGLKKTNGITRSTLGQSPHTLLSSSTSTCCRDTGNSRSRRLYSLPPPPPPRFLSRSSSLYASSSVVMRRSPMPSCPANRRPSGSRMEAMRRPYSFAPCVKMCNSKSSSARCIKRRSPGRSFTQWRQCPLPRVNSCSSSASSAGASRRTRPWRASCVACSSVRSRSSTSDSLRERSSRAIVCSLTREAVPRLNSMSGCEGCSCTRSFIAALRTLLSSAWQDEHMPLTTSGWLHSRYSNNAAPASSACPSAASTRTTTTSVPSCTGNVFFTAAVRPLLVCT